MAQDALSKLLSSRDWLMADGATGTNLFNMGLSSGEPPEFWNTEQPDNIRSLYRSAVEAGSDIFLTNSFGGNAARLKLHSAQGCSAGNVILRPTAPSCHEDPVVEAPPWQQ